MITQLADSWEVPVREALACKKPSAGLTHNFYHYPARFSPTIARAVIAAFSEPGDLVLDPFMGGGTTIIEALAAGREAVGSDLNSLAHFVADARTTPLSAWDEIALREWVTEATELVSYREGRAFPRAHVDNFPRAVEMFMAQALEAADALGLDRRKNFARCALLRLGQWALDCRDFVLPRRQLLAKQLPIIVEDMFKGLAAFVASCVEAGIPKKAIRGMRHLFHANAKELALHVPTIKTKKKPTLVFTSPPYPGVHVLYHRWQYRGRSETAAPYWIADVKDGEGGAFYTAGSRTPTGEKNYFQTIRDVFTAVHAVVDPNAVIAQLVGFARAQEQLPLYLETMRAAGFEVLEGAPPLMQRRVPNRKWYARIKGDVDASSEVLLLHRPMARTTETPPSA